MKVKRKMTRINNEGMKTGKQKSKKQKTGKIDEVCSP